MKKKSTDEPSQSQKPLLYKDHKLPVSRRDFLSSGLIAMSTMAFTSSGLLMSGSAWAQANCAEAVAFFNQIVPYICLDCAGGMNIAGGNALVGQTSSQEQGDFGALNLSDYRRLGIPDEFHPSKTGMVNKELGIKFHATSGILDGIQQVLTPRMGETKDLRDYVDGLLICAITNDDTQTNPINTAFQANKAGAAGKLVQLIGTANSESGGNSRVVQNQYDSTKKPSQINNFGGAKGLLSIGDSLMSGNYLNSDKDRMNKFMALVARSGSSQRKEIAGRSPAMNAEIGAYEQRQGGLKTIFDKFSPSSLDPATNPADRAIILDVYNKTPAQGLASLSGQEQQSAAILNLVTSKIAGAGTISVGGGDYHTGNAVVGQNKDIEIGKYIGWAIRMANARGVPLFLHLFTDGGVNGDPAGIPDSNLPTRTAWMSDDGVRSAALVIAFNPNKARTQVGDDEHSNYLMPLKTRQIGFYNPAQGNNLGAHSLVNNVNNLWMAIILNYLSFQMDTNDLAQVEHMVETKFRCTFGDMPADWKKFIRLRPYKAA